MILGLGWAEWFLVLWGLLLGILLTKAGLAYWRYRKQDDDDA